MREGRFFTCGNDSSAPLVQIQILLLIIITITFMETMSETGANHVAAKQTSALLP